MTTHRRLNSLLTWQTGPVSSLALSRSIPFRGGLGRSDLTSTVMT